VFGFFLLIRYRAQPTNLYNWRELRPVARWRSAWAWRTGPSSSSDASFGKLSFAALSGELAMPCTCDRLAGPRSPPEAARVRLKPVTAALMARSRAMGPREPCQGREAAALSG
jgi:hypothetical protein